MSFGVLAEEFISRMIEAHLDSKINRKSEDPNEFIELEAEAEAEAVSNNVHVLEDEN